MHEDPGTVRDSRVSGYLAKTAGPDELRRALNASARGTDNIVVEVPRQTLLGLSDGAAKVIHTLTAREREILTYSPPRRGRASDRMIRDFHVRASEQVESGPGSGHSFATGLLWVGARHCEQPRQRVLDRVDLVQDVGHVLGAGIGQLADFEEVDQVVFVLGSPSDQLHR
jgi:hypothetical protein